MPDKIDTPFSDYIIPYSSGEASFSLPVQPTLGNGMGDRCVQSPQAGVTHATPIRILNDIDDLHYGTVRNGTDFVSRDRENGVKDF